MEAQELSEALDLSFWADNEGVSYKETRGHSGPQLNFKECPSCGDKKSKVYLNAETGLGNCFRCDKKFNKLEFIHLHYGTAWRDTFRLIKEVLKAQGWRPARKTAAAVEYGTVKLPLSIELPTSDGQNLVYLEKRGITGELAKYFHLRYCIQGWWNWTKDDGSTGGQKFDERVIIPVFDLDGTLRTFQGRDITETSDRKYLFPAGLPGTGVFLYNGQNAGYAPRAILNEGVFDVYATKIALDEDPSLRDVIPLGTFGKSLSYGTMDGNDQLGRLLQLKTRGLKEVTFMWDGEVAALEAAIKAGELVKKIGLAVKIALLPKDKDPNEVPAAVVRQAFYSATPLTSQVAIKWRLRNPYA